VSVRNDTTIDSVAEAYRTLRSTVKFAAGDGPIRSLLVVDIDRETPSGSAESLAGSFADAGDRVVLVDLRSGAPVDQVLPGFSDLIAANVTPADLLTARTPTGLQTIGPGKQFTSDLLAGDRFATAISSLTDSGAFVVVCCNSAPRHADALAIAPRVDSTLLVVTGGSTRRAPAIEARDALERVGTRLLGIVMLEQKKRWFW
jgi:hypothetical protein